MVDWSKYKKGGDGPQQAVPITHAEALALAREAGAIPAGVPDANVVFEIMGQFGSITLTSEEDPEPLNDWHEGEPLPHTSFDDPPGGMTPAMYQLLLAGAMSMSADLDEFTRRLTETMGADLVDIHGVPRDVADRGCAEFAARLWQEHRGC